MLWWARKANLKTEGGSMKERDLAAHVIGLSPDIVRISECAQMRDASAAHIAELRSQVTHNRTLRHSGTTIVGFLYKNGVIMAADRQSTSGWEKEFESVKIHKITEHVLFGGAGLVALIQSMREAIIRTGKHFEGFLGNPLDVDSYALITKHLLKENFLAFGLYSEILGYIAVPIIAGVSADQSRASLYSFDSAGAIYDHVSNSRQFAVIGSGSVYAKGVLEDSWAKNMSEDDAIRLAVRAIYRAGGSDIGSGHADINPPMIVLVTTNGLQEVMEESVRKIAWSIRVDDCRRRGDMESARLYRRLLKGEKS